MRYVGYCLSFTMCRCHKRIQLAGERYYDLVTAIACQYGARCDMKFKSATNIVLLYFSWFGSAITFKADPCTERLRDHSLSCIDGELHVTHL